MAYNQQYGQQPQYPQQAYYSGPPGGGDKGPQMYENGAPGMQQQGYYPPPQQGPYQGQYQGQQPMYYGQQPMNQPNVVVQQQPRDSGPGCCAVCCGCLAALLCIDCLF